MFEVWEARDNISSAVMAVVHVEAHFFSAIATMEI